MGRISAALLALAPLVGCAHYLKLDPKNVNNLEVTSGEDGNGKQICARGGIVDVAALTKDGKKHYEGATGAPDEKHFDPKLVRLTASVGKLNDRSWNPPDDAFAMLDQNVTITATLVANPSVTASVELAPHWACEPPAAIVGGGDGGAGEQGPDAVNNVMGPGGDGGTGGRGGNGSRTVVSIGWLERPKGKLAIVHIAADGVGEFVYLLDPSTKLRVWDGGGTGGAGGFGGQGDPQQGPGTHSGNGGRGGDGGDGGDGGEVTIQYDAQSPELAQLVTAENGEGGGGNGGGGGPSGYADDEQHLGQTGAEGRGGRAGRPGPQARIVPVPGLGGQLVAMTGRRGQGATAEPPQPPTKPTRPGRPGKIDRTPKPPEPVAIQHPTAPSGPASKMRSRDDGERVYVATSHADISLPNRPKLQHTSTNQPLISTRTRKHHFTIDLGDGCVLAFHRPDGEKRHVYDLDGLTRCDLPQGQLAIATAHLTLETARDTLAVVLDGTVTAKGGGAKKLTGRLHMTIDAKRR